jgi:hypothetical protein
VREDLGLEYLNDALKRWFRLVLLGGCLAGSFASAAWADKDYVSPELACGGSTIQLFCYGQDGEYYGCKQNYADFRLADGRTKRVMLPERYSWGPIIAEADCGYGDGGDYVFVYFKLFPRGSLRDASVDIYMPDGTALTVGGREFGSIVERFHIMHYEPSRTVRLEEKK